MFSRNGRYACIYCLIWLCSLGWAKSEQNFSERLGWEKCDCNICRGKFNELHEVAGSVFQKTEITADNPTYLDKGVSLLQGNVILTQPGRQLKADQILLFLEDDRKLSKGELRGGIFFQERGRLVVAEKGMLNFKRQFYVLENSYYRLQTDDQTNTYLWGKAEKAEYTSRQLRITNGSLSSCSPESSAWIINGEKIHFNFEENEADVQHAIFYLKNIPVFYWPHYKIFLNHKRKSGILWSMPYYNNHSGYVVGMPVYLNLAPNYDWLIKPNFMSKRGVFFENTLRYLTVNSRGRLFLGNIFHDRQFKDVKGNWKNLMTIDEHAGARLRDSSLSRFGSSWEHKYQFNRFWKLNWQLNYASDDYFTYHFEQLLHQSGERDQLLNRIALEYRDDRWQWLTKIEAFQTLHPILYGDNVEQYRRLPQLNVKYRNFWKECPYGFTGEWVVFQKRAYGYHPHVISGRGYFEPFLKMKKEFTSYWYSDITMRLFSNYYQLWEYRDYRNHSLVNAVPSFKVGQTLYLERKLTSFSNIKQTLEPSLVYHFVPYRNQDHFPLFDSFLTSVDCEQLLRENRFAGKDRFGDSNQLIIKLKSRLLDKDAFERFSFNLVQVYAFQKHRVQLKNSYSDDPLVNNHLSPLCFQLRGYFNRQVSLILDSAWNFKDNKVDSVRLMGKYAYSPDQVFNVWYHFGINGDQYKQNQPVDLHRFGIAGSINLFRGWQAIGKMNYNISYHRVQDYFAGISYNGCCWALRVIVGQEFVSIGSDFSKNYDTKIYLQFSLKGLTSMEIRDVRGLIKQDIPNYQDQLAKWQNGY